NTKCAIHFTLYCVTIQVVYTLLLSSFSYHFIFIPALIALSTLCTTCCVYSSQLLYIAIPPCIYLSDHCAVVLYCLCCVVLYILCKYNESHLTRSQIPCLCKLNCANKRDS